MFISMCFFSPFDRHVNFVMSILYINVLISVRYFYVENDFATFRFAFYFHAGQQLQQFHWLRQMLLQ
jgi:hypothetical protein